MISQKFKMMNIRMSNNHLMLIKKRTRMNNKKILQLYLKLIRIELDQN